VQSYTNAPDACSNFEEGKEREREREREKVMESPVLSTCNSLCIRKYTLDPNLASPARKAQPTIP